MQTISNDAYTGNSVNKIWNEERLFQVLCKLSIS